MRARGLDAGGVLRQVGLVGENPEVCHHKPECHQCDTRANPGEKRSLFGEIIPQVGHWLCFDRGIHFSASHDWIGTHVPRHRESGNAVLLSNVFGIREMTWPLLPSLARFLRRNGCRIESPRRARIRPAKFNLAYVRRCGTAVAVLATASRAAAMARTAASTSWPSPCRLASQLGSLYESHVLPDRSCQTNAFSGRSIPIV